MFIDRHHQAEIEMLIPAEPCFGLPWRWILAAVLLLILALAANI
jgi:hypothetical protein